MREVFISNVQAIRKTEEKAPFISTEKWQAYMDKLELDPQTFTFDMVESTLLQIEYAFSSALGSLPIAYHPAYICTPLPLLPLLTRALYRLASPRSHISCALDVEWKKSQK